MPSTVVSFSSFLHKCIFILVLFLAIFFCLPSTQSPVKTYENKTFENCFVFYNDHATIADDMQSFLLFMLPHSCRVHVDNQHLY